MSDVDAKVSAVVAMGDALGAFNRASLRLVDDAGREVAAIVRRFDAELSRRVDRHAAAERQVTTAAAALARCTEDCGQLQAQLDAACREEERCRRLVVDARRALAQVEEAIRRFHSHQRVFSDMLIGHLPVASSSVANYLIGLQQYLAVDTTAAPGRLGGSAPIATASSPTSTGSLASSVIDISSIRDSNPVTSRDQFEKTSYEHVVWGLDRLKAVVEPAVQLGKGIEYFEERDRREGLSGERSNAGVYRWYYGDDSAIKVERMPDGSLDVVNGRHRLFAAGELGIRSLPGRVR